MLDILVDSMKDTVRVVPTIFLLFVLVDLIMMRLNTSAPKFKGAGSLGIIGGSLLGLLPQCGIPVGMAKLFTKSYIGLGVLMAVFLSSSDEALIVLSAHPDKWTTVLGIVAFKIVVGIVFGLIISALLSESSSFSNADKLLNEAADKDFITILKHSALSTIKITVFLLATIFLIGLGLHNIGEEGLTQIVGTHSVLQPVIAAFVGAIPSCMSSIVITEGYIQGIVGLGALVSGLLANTGYGILIILRELPLKKSLSITGLLLGISIAVGQIVSLFAF